MKFLTLAMADPATTTATILGIIISSLAVMERAGEMLKRLKRGDPITEEEIAGLETAKAAADGSWQKKLKELRDHVNGPAEAAEPEPSEDEDAEPEPEEDSGEEDEDVEPEPPLPQPLFT